jgi:hypothetical protein
MPKAIHLMYQPTRGSADQSQHLHQFKNLLSSSKVWKKGLNNAEAQPLSAGAADPQSVEVDAWRGRRNATGNQRERLLLAGRWSHRPGKRESKNVDKRRGRSSSCFNLLLYTHRPRRTQAHFQERYTFNE